MIYSRKNAALALLLLVSGCSFKSAEPQSPVLGTNLSNAPFAVAPITVMQVETSQIDPAWGLANQKVYHLKACAVQRATSQPLSGVAFHLHRGGTKQALELTDALGCAFWSETVEFTPLQREAFVSIPRSLEINGASVALPLAVNPWLDGTAGLIDLRVVHKVVPPVAEAESEKALRGDRVVSQTLVETVSLSPIRQEGDAITYSFTGKVKALRPREDASLGEVTLPQGEFKTRLSILEIAADGTQKRVARGDIFSIRVDQGNFAGTSLVTYVAPLDARAQLVAFYELVPVSDASGVATTDGLKTLASARQSASGAPDRTVDTLAQARQAVLTPLAREIRQDERVFLTDGSLGQFDAVTAFDPQTSRISVGFTAQVRLVDALSISEPIRRHPFEYIVSDTPNWPVGVAGRPEISDFQGNVRTQGEVTYNELSAAPEAYVRKYILLRSPLAPYQGVTRSVEIWINPFQRGNLFYKDAKNQGIPHAAAIASPARLTAKNYNAYFLQRRFELNEHLQLTTLREWNLTLQPMVQRPNPSGKAEPVALSPGTRFRMQVVLADPSIDASARPLEAFLSAYEAEVQVNDANQINAPLVFAIDFTQQARLDSRTRIHITLSPLTGQADSLAPYTLSANFVSNPNGNDNSAGETIDADATRRGDLVNIPKDKTTEFALSKGRAYALRLDWKLPPLLAYEQYWKGYSPVESIGLDDIPALSTDWKRWSEWSGNGNQQLQNFARGDGSDAQKVASAALKPFCISLGKEAEACSKAPQEFFHLSHFSVVDKVLTTSPIVDRTENVYTNLSVAFFNEHQRTHRMITADKSAEQFMRGVSGKVGYGLLGNEATVNTAYNKQNEWYEIAEDASGDSQRSRVSNVDTVQLSREEIVLGLRVLARRCALVRPLRFSLALSESRGKPLSSTLVCTGPTEQQTQESWFSVRDRWSAVHSSHSDPKDPRERGWSKLIRGTASFRVLDHTLRDATREYYFKKVDPYIDGVDGFLAKGFYTDAEKARVARDGGIFPGVLTLSQSSELKWREGQIRRYVEIYLTDLAKKTQNESALAAGARFATCFYETAARRWDYAEYTARPGNPERFNEALRADGTRERCMNFAREAK